MLAVFLKAFPILYQEVGFTKLFKRFLRQKLILKIALKMFYISLFTNLAKILRI
jgi:hypothetical protein